MEIDPHFPSPLLSSELFSAIPNPTIPLFYSCNERQPRIPWDSPLLQEINKTNFLGHLVCPWWTYLLDFITQLKYHLFH